MWKWPEDRQRHCESVISIKCDDRKKLLCIINILAGGKRVGGGSKTRAKGSPFHLKIQKHSGAMLICFI